MVVFFLFLSGNEENRVGEVGRKKYPLEWANLLGVRPPKAPHCTNTNEGRRTQFGGTQGGERRKDTEEGHYI